MRDPLRKDPLRSVCCKSLLSLGESNSKDRLRDQAVLAVSWNFLNGFQRRRSESEEESTGTLTWLVRGFEVFSLAECQLIRWLRPVVGDSQQRSHFGGEWLE